MKMTDLQKTHRKWARSRAKDGLRQLEIWATAPRIEGNTIPARFEQFAIESFRQSAHNYFLAHPELRA